MFVIRIADLNVRIYNMYPFVKAMCHDYLTDAKIEIDMDVRVTDSDIDQEIALSAIPVTRDYAEAVCVYRLICQRLPMAFEAFLFHAAVVSVDGFAYAFAATSGTGKSTHIRLWQKYLGERVHIINGDKPILRFVNDQLMVYGTPWCGKEGYQENTSAPLKAICFLERGLTNSILPISAEEAVGRIFSQILSPTDLETVDALFPLLDRTLRQIPCYLLRCNMDVEAAEVAYLGMNSG